MWFSLVLLYSGLSSAQLDHQYWHFGSTNRGLFFDASSSYSVSVTTNSYTPYGNEGSTVVSDPTTGFLLFYSDAMTVVDNSHQAMPNGTGLLGHSSNFSSGKGCQVPGQCDQYYVFSVNTALEVGTPGALRYSIVDMSLPGNGSVGAPLGDVVAGQKNILIANDVSESLEIVPKANSHDFWLLIGKEGLNAIDVYSVTSSGIIFSSTYAIPITMDNIVCMDHCQENGKIALLSYQEMYPTLIADFDNSSGTFTAIMAIPGTPWGASSFLWQGTFDSEWSPDGTKLYLSKYRWGGTSGGRLYQYDLNTPLVAPLLIHSVGTSNSAVARGIKLAPDGKIYMMYKPASGASQFLHAVNNPNAAGLGCGFATNVVNMGIDLGITHLFPDFLYYQNSIPQIPDSTISFICQFPSTISINPLDGYADNEADNLSFTVNSIVGGTQSITGTTLNITPDVGTNLIEVEIIYQDDFCFPLSDTMIIQFSLTAGTGTLAMPDSLFTCNVNPVQIDAGSGFASYVWSTGEITQTIDVVTSGMYSVETTDGVCDYQDSTFVQFNSPTPVNLGADQTICADSLELSVGVFSGDLNWSDGSNGTTNWVSSSGEYSVIAENSFGCLSYDTVDIILNPIPVIDLGPDQQACLGDEIYLEAIGYNSVLWSDASTNDSLEIFATGNYSVTVTNVFLCSASDDVIITINAPTAVSLGFDQTICADSLALSIGVFTGNVNWSDGSTGNSNWVNSSGEYSVIAENSFGCLSYDTVDIVLNPIPVIDLGPDQQACLGDEIYLEAVGYNSVLWSDASTNDQLLVTSSGNYSVLVSNVFGCTNSDQILINFNLPQQIALGPDLTICDTEILLSASGVVGTISWSDGTIGNTNLVNSSGQYSVLALDINGCESADTVFVFLAPIPDINLGSDTLICPDDFYLVAAGFTSVLWSNGSSLDSIQISATGIYSVEVINDFGCTASDQISIEIIDPTAIDLGPDFETCNQNEVVLSTGLENGIFQWSTEQYSSSIIVTESGTYYVTQQVCGVSVTDSIRIDITILDQTVYIPNAFTPDGNNLNPVFEVVFGDYTHVLNFQLVIYNRWGEAVFSTTDPYASWNGTGINGVVQDGVYAYVVKIETDCGGNQIWVKNGHVAVLK